MLALTLAGLGECSLIEVSEYYNRDNDYSYCYHYILEIPIHLQGLRISLMSQGIKGLHYKAKRKIYNKIMPHAII